MTNSEANKLVWQRPGYREKMSLAHKGQIPTNLVWLIENSKTPEYRKKVSERFKGKPSPLGMLGKHHSEDTKEKMSRAKEGYVPSNLSSLVKRGSENRFWKGGVTSIYKKIRGSIEYRKWRKSVFVRDDYVCQICKIRGGRLQADHIKPFAYFSELRFDINNGRTLCLDCHKKTDTYMGRAIKNYKLKT